MGRQSPASADTRRTQLVDAAYDVFNELGYTKAGISDITRKAGVAHGTFYRYFESKRDILDHVVDFGFAKVVTELGHTTTTLPDTFDELLTRSQTTCLAILDLVAREPGLARIIIFEATGVDEDLTARIVGLADIGAAAISTFIEDAAKRGVVRDDVDAEIAGKVLSGALLPAVLDIVRGTTDQAARERYAQNAISLVVAGMRRPTETERERR